MERLTSLEKAIAILAVTFSTLALLIMATGIFGLLAYQVRQRTPEIGVRIALGATRQLILMWLLRHAMLAFIAGSLSGLVCAWILARYAQSLLYGLEAHSLLAFGGCWLAILLSVLVAILIPARRASSVDPMQALRTE